MKQKFYAVQRGRVPGLYFSWNDYAQEVLKYSGAEFKSFGSLAQTEDYLFQGMNQGCYRLGLGRRKYVSIVAQVPEAANPQHCSMLVELVLAEGFCKSIGWL